MMKRINRLLKYLPDKCACALSQADLDRMEELRFRVNARPFFYAGGKAYPLNCPAATEEEVWALFDALCAHSPHHYARSIASGYFTVEGMRVGVSGSFDGDRVTAVTGLALRVARQFPGICRAIMPYLEDGRALNTILFSRPGQGKTTLARDVARELASRMKVCVIDERGELSAMGQFDVGEQTDVLTGLDKERAADMALRALSPDVMVTDELGSRGEAETLRRIIASGVAVVATAHAPTADALKAQPIMAGLAGAFDRYVMLDDGLGRITVANVYDRRLTPMLACPVRLTNG